jgi:hypothetical protein
VKVAEMQNFEPGINDLNTTKTPQVSEELLGVGEASEHARMHCLLYVVSQI